MTLRRATIAAAALVLLIVAALTLDYAVMRLWTRSSDARVAALQLRVERDYSLAPALAAEQNKIAVYIRARRTRINVLSLVLLAAAAGFL